MPPSENLFIAIDAGDIPGVKRQLHADAGMLAVRRIAFNPDGSRERASECPTALQAAAMAGHLEIVKLLIELGANIYESGQWGYPAVEHAMWKKQQHIVDFFLGEGAAHPTIQGAPTYGLGCDVNLAARNGQVDLVNKRIARDKLAVHRRGVIGETPLHWAAHDNHADVVTALLDAGADIEADEIGLYGGKPLHWASEHEPGIVRLLLARGAAVNSRNVLPGAGYNGVTPLIMVATQRNDCDECVEILIAAGADLQARDVAGRSALDWAITKGATKVETALRSHGCQ